MPQGRRKDFSGKQKKQQMLQKRQNAASKQHRDPMKETIRGPTHYDTVATSSASVLKDAHVSGDTAVPKPDQTFNLIDSVQLTSRTKGGRQKYELRFRTETKEEIMRLKEESRKPLKPINPKLLECDGGDNFPDDVEIPFRPPWNKSLSKKQLEINEEKYFRDYCSNLIQNHNNTSHFELNLETWRQLWRVIEMSDILLLIVDCRFPTAMFPPSLYKLIQKLGKDLILVFNKVDLIPIDLVIKWEYFFKSKYPGVEIVYFSSCPNYNLRVGIDQECPGLRYRKLKGRIRMVAEGAQSVLEVCEKLVRNSGANLNFESWRNLIEESKEDSGEEEETMVWNKDMSETEEEREDHSSRFHDGILTLGMLGTPNAGKSSLINSLMGKRVVSVSKTPGHTKHFQTIFVTKNVKLCDCPGLVFPSLVPKPLQIIMGSFPISQVREPFSVVKFLAERLDLISLLRIKHPDAENASSDNEVWSAFDICEAWALKRGYVTARSNRADAPRAANHILRMTLEGKIGFHLMPKNSSENFLEENPEFQQKVKQIHVLLGLDREADDAMEDLGSLDSENEEEEKEQQDEMEEEKPKISNKFSALILESDSD